jgi:tetratricopeptide (TPR) repeat protein
LASSATATSAELSEAILQWQSLSGPAAAHNNLGAVYIEQTRYAEARRELEQALEFERGNGAALKNLAWLSTVDGKPAQLPPPSSAQMKIAQQQKSKPSIFKRMFVRTQTTEQSFVTPELASSAQKQKRPHNSNQNPQ